MPDTEYGDIHNEVIGVYNIARAGFFYTELRYHDMGELESEIKTLVEQVERECPYIRTFGVSGIGEGIFWKPRDYFSNLDFWSKSKGEIFEVTARNKLPVSELRSDSADRVKSLAEAIVTDNRLEQGWKYLKEMRVIRDKRGLGRFLKWIVEDCLTEEREMEGADTKGKDIKPAIIGIAKPWYQSKISSSWEGETQDDT